MRYDGGRLSQYKNYKFSIKPKLVVATLSIVTKISIKIKKGSVVMKVNILCKQNMVRMLSISISPKK